MRYLNDAEKQLLSDQAVCPHCMGNLFYLGPVALGLAINVYCRDCLAGYNVTHQQLPWMLICEAGEKTREEIMQMSTGVVDMHEINATINKAVEDSVRFAFDRLNKK